MTFLEPSECVQYGGWTACTQHPNTTLLLYVIGRRFCFENVGSKITCRGGIHNCTMDLCHRLACKAPKLQRQVTAPQTVAAVIGLLGRQVFTPMYSQHNGGWSEGRCESVTDYRIE